MSLGNTTETDVLGLLFNSTALSGSWSTSLYCSLHTADPGESGNQTTNEISYTGYARVAVTRANTSGWTVSGGQVSNAGAVTFGTMTAGAGGTVTHLGIGLASSSTGQILGTGPVTPNIAVTTSVQPNFPASSIVLTLD